MYSYQHRYHAGSFADIHKHLVLLSVLTRLQKKTTPFCVLDAFAGEGIYNLHTSESQKTKEYNTGFAYLKQAQNLPPLLAKLLSIAGSLKTMPDDLFYPGSPALIQPHLREQDRGILIENHPQAFAELKKNFNRYSNIHLHKRDALEALNALLPFPEKRGLIFIDPSYEVKTEYQQIANLVVKLHHKFSQGIYVIWYPILPEAFHENLLKILKKAQIEHWSSQWRPYPEMKTGMIGSGVFVLNPPWRLKEEMTVLFEFLKRDCFQESRFHFE